MLSTHWPLSACGPVHLPVEDERSVYSSGPLWVAKEQPLTAGHQPCLWEGCIL